MAIDLAGGRPWVLVPGTLCTGAVFDPFLDALRVPRAARRVVDLDNDRIEDHLPVLRRELEPGAVLCGFSLGAIVVAHLADRLPASGMLHFGLNPRADSPEKREGRLELLRDVRNLGGEAALAARLGPLRGPDPEAAHELILAMAGEATEQIGAHTELALTRPGALPALSRTNVPMLFLTGTEDSQAPITLAEEAAAAAPQGKVQPLSGLGHYALVEDPETCARTVRVHWTSCRE